MLPLARVPGVTPRPLIAALAIALAAIASGCATFTDSNNVARVGDETLSNDELREIVSAITGTPIGETTDGVNGINFVGNAYNARTAIEFWVTGQIARAELDALASEVPAETRDETQVRLASVTANFAELSTAARDLIIDLEAAIVVFGGQPGAADAFVVAAEGSDVYVDPRFGAYEVTGQVVPLT